MTNIIIFILFPIIGALIGWGTNFLAIRMLFKPYDPIKILGFKLHGLIPRRQHDFSLGMAETIEKELLKKKDITKIIENLKFKNLVSKIPALGMVPTTMLSMVEEPIKKEITKEIEDNLDLKSIITERMDTFAAKKLEEVVLGIAKKELRYIEFIGLGLGFTIGLLQAVLLKLIGG